MALESSLEGGRLTLRSPLYPGVFPGTGKTSKRLAREACIGCKWAELAEPGMVGKESQRGPFSLRIGSLGSQA